MIGNIKNEEIRVNKTNYRAYSVFLAQKIIYQNNFSTIPDIIMTMMLSNYFESSTNGYIKT